ncbi:hypothetical protein Tsubulata_010277, partial [Turnera subulata]
VSSLLVSPTTSLHRKTRVVHSYYYFLISTHKSANLDQMAKVHPRYAESSSSTCSSSTSYVVTAKTETFTVWMKSLVMQANGCTVYNENGDIVYRMDNYDKKGSNEVHLMDLKGNVLFTILKRKQWFHRQWKGYRCDGLQLRDQKPFFEVAKCHGIFQGGSQDSCLYRLEALAGESALKITDSRGGLVAVMKPQVDQAFIMALVTVYGLIRHKLTPLFLMAKIHPLAPLNVSSPSCSSSNFLTTKREAFTVWMKSLVVQGNGCTVFNEGGEIVYRVDNYDKKCCNDVYLMDLKGNVIFSILKRGYRCDASSQVKNLKPFFRVKQNLGLWGEDLSCTVTLQSNNGHANSYRLESFAGKSAFKVVNSQGEVVAEAKRKEVVTGVLLGDDVLNLVVEPHVDRSLIMALTVVYGLVHRRL